jgi:hypothetical protein
MTAKQKTLNQTEQNVRHATRSLADKRQQMQRSQASLAELEQNKLKSEKLVKPYRLSIRTITLVDQMTPPPLRSGTWHHISHRRSLGH